MYSFIIKPFFDFVIALLFFAILSPVFIIMMLLLVITQGTNPFFLQERPGKGEKIFRIVKFKTMNNKKDPEGNLLPDAQRLTRLGAFIRSTSLDEIPQLINVIKGDMSLVGPRPLLPEYLELYSAFQRQRHQVKPGITGYAQVNGRNVISWEKKFELDVYYVKNRSFVLDMMILLKTVKKVVTRDGVNKANTATMSRFTGTNNK
jgi:lipopolysaccharide/colanic/teichoic acid biosynthesis glycosyltransferase